MIYELNEQGFFVCDIPGGVTKGVGNWTAVPIPQPTHRPYMMGGRNLETGEWTGAWEDAGPVPHVRTASDVLARLAAIDTESIRPLRAMVAGTATAGDTSKLAALDTEAAALRAELAAL